MKQITFSDNKKLNQKQIDCTEPKHVPEISSKIKVGEYSHTCPCCKYITDYVVEKIDNNNNNK